MLLLIIFIKQYKRNSVTKPRLYLNFKSCCLSAGKSQNAMTILQVSHEVSVYDVSNLSFSHNKNQVKKTAKMTLFET